MNEKWTWKETIVLVAVIVFAIIFLGCGENKNQPEPSYVRQNTPCQSVMKFEMCCGIFSDRYIVTNTNRYKIYERDNIVVGDSVCRYEWSDTSYKSSKLGIKNKDIFIYE
jgi:hypothetical protein